MAAQDEQSNVGGRPQTDRGMVRRSPFIVTSLVRANEEIAMAIGGDVVVELRGTALELWRLILEDVRIDALIEHLADTYDVEPTTIASDVVAAVDRLVAEGLLEMVRA